MFQYSTDFAFKRGAYVTSIQVPLDSSEERLHTLCFDSPVTQADALNQVELYLGEPMTRDDFRLAFPYLVDQFVNMRLGLPVAEWEIEWEKKKEGTCRGDLLENNYEVLGLLELGNGAIRISHDRLTEEEEEVDFHEEPVVRIIVPPRERVFYPLSLVNGSFRRGNIGMRRCDCDT